MTATRTAEGIWDALAGRRFEVVQAFYERLFERYPEYRAMFPGAMDRQMEKMVEMLGAVLRFCGHVDVIRPYLLRAARAHRSLAIESADLRHFTQTLPEVLSEACPEQWTEASAREWRRALDDVVIPIFEEGLEMSGRP